jgi:hypothetical protein
MTIGELYVSLKADTKQFEAAMQASLTKTQGFVKGHEAQFKKIGAAVTVAGAAITAALGLTIKAYKDEEVVVQKLSHIMTTATGASNAQIESLKKQASELQKIGVVGDDVTMSLQAQLGTFQLNTETIKKMTPAILDMVVAEKGVNATTEDMISFGNAFGMAMEGNYAALTRRGFKIDENTKQIIAHGTETEKAAAIVQYLESVYKGTNAAMQETAAGGMASLKNSFGDLQESIGQNLIPILNSLVQKITPVINKISDWMERNPALAKTMIIITAAIGVLGTVLGPIIMALPLIVSGITTLTTILPILGTAFTVATGPVGLIIAAIAALIAIGVLIVKNWDTIKAAAKAMWDGIVGFVKAGVNLYIGYLNTLIRAVLGGINLIIKGLNKIPKVNIPTIPVPQIKTLHEGGIYQAPTPGGEGLAMLRDRERVIPAGVSESAANMGGGVKTIQVNNPLSPEDLERIVRMVRRDNMMTGYVKRGLQGV